MKNYYYIFYTWSFSGYTKASSSITLLTRNKMVTKLRERIYQRRLIVTRGPSLCILCSANRYLAKYNILSRHDKYISLGWAREQKRREWFTHHLCTGRCNGGHSSDRVIAESLQILRGGPNQHSRVNDTRIWFMLLYKAYKTIKGEFIGRRRYSLWTLGFYSLCMRNEGGYAATCVYLKECGGAPTR